MTTTKQFAVHVQVERTYILTIEADTATDAWMKVVSKTENNPGFFDEICSVATGEPRVEKAIEIDPEPEAPIHADDLKLVDDFCMNLGLQLRDRDWESIQQHELIRPKDNEPIENRVADDLRNMVLEAFKDLHLTRATRGEHSAAPAPKIPPPGTLQWRNMVKLGARVREALHDDDYVVLYGDEGTPLPTSADITFEPNGNRGCIALSWVRDNGSRCTHRIYEHDVDSLNYQGAEEAFKDLFQITKTVEGW